MGDKTVRAIQIEGKGRWQSIRYTTFPGLAEITPDLDLIFSDDLIDTYGFSGGVYCGFYYLYFGLVPLGSSVEIYDVEITAAVSGAQEALETADASFFGKNQCLWRQ